MINVFYDRISKIYELDKYIYIFKFKIVYDYDNLWLEILSIVTHNLWQETNKINVSYNESRTLLSLSKSWAKKIDSEKHAIYFII